MEPVTGSLKNAPDHVKTSRAGSALIGQKAFRRFFHGLVEKKSPVITAVASRPAIPARIGRDPARFPRPDRRHHRLDAEDVERPPQVVGDCLQASAGTFTTKAARPRQSSADNYAAVHHFS